MTRLLALLFALAAIALLTTPAQAQETTTAHCAEDPSGNQWIDTQDIAMFTGVFGGFVEELDIAPFPGDGFVDTQDIAEVTAHFGEGCIGATEMDPMGGPPQGDSLSAAGAFNCEFKTFGRYTARDGDYMPVFEWGGQSHCLTVNGHYYASGCWFGFSYLGDDGAWHLAASSADNWEFSQSIMGGQYCGAPGNPTFLPCGHYIQGVFTHQIREGGMYGPFVHEPEYHGGIGENDFFQAC